MNLYQFKPHFLIRHHNSNHICWSTPGPPRETTYTVSDSVQPLRCSADVAFISTLTRLHWLSATPSSFDLRTDHYLVFILDPISLTQIFGCRAFGKSFAGRSDSVHTTTSVNISVGPQFRGRFTVILAHCAYCISLADHSVHIVYHWRHHRLSNPCQFPTPQYSAAPVRTTLPTTLRVSGKLLSGIPKTPITGNSDCLLSCTDCLRAQQLTRNWTRPVQTFFLAPHHILTYIHLWLHANATFWQLAVRSSDAHLTLQCIGPDPMTSYSSNTFSSDQSPHVTSLSISFAMTTPGTIDLSRLPTLTPEKPLTPNWTGVLPSVFLLRQPHQFQYRDGESRNQKSVQHNRFRIFYCPWSNRAVEHLNCKMIRVTQALLYELRQHAGSGYISYLYFSLRSTSRHLHITLILPTSLLSPDLHPHHPSWHSCLPQLPVWSMFEKSTAMWFYWEAIFLTHFRVMGILILNRTTWPPYNLSSVQPYKLAGSAPVHLPNVASSQIFSKPNLYLSPMKNSKRSKSCASDGTPTLWHDKGSLPFFPSWGLAKQNSSWSEHHLLQAVLKCDFQRQVSYSTYALVRGRSARVALSPSHCHWRHMKLETLERLTSLRWYAIALEHEYKNFHGLSIQLITWKPPLNDLFIEASRAHSVLDQWVSHAIQAYTRPTHYFTQCQWHVVEHPPRISCVHNNDPTDASFTHGLPYI